MIRILKALLRIGTRVINGTAKSVLYVDANGNLAEDNLDLQYDDSVEPRLGVGTNGAPAEVIHGASDGSGGIRFDAYDSSLGQGENRAQLWLNGARGSRSSPLDLSDGNIAALIMLQGRVAGDWDQLATIAAYYNTTLANRLILNVENHTVEFDGNGALIVDGVSAEPPLSAAGKVALYFDTDTSKLRASQSGAAYQDVIQAAGATSFLGSEKWVSESSQYRADGAAGRVQFADGSGQHRSADQLHWDDANKRLGIGTGAPSTALHVSTGILRFAAASAESQFVELGTDRFIHTSGDSSIPGSNLFVGRQSGNTSSTSTRCTGIGYQALFNNSSGTRNTAIGYQALRACTTAQQNTAVGSGALTALVSSADSVDNCALGTNCLASLVSGMDNTAMGSLAMQLANNCDFNAAFGSLALSKATGDANCSFGNFSLQENTTGANNCAFGYYAGHTTTAANANVSGSHNTWIGYDTGPGTTTQLGYSMALGAKAKVSESNACVIGSSAVGEAVKIITGSSSVQITETTGHLRYQAIKDAFVSQAKWGVD